MAIRTRYDSPRQIAFVRLRSRYFCLLASIVTWQTDLKEFLIDDAQANQRLLISSTYLIFDNKDFRDNKAFPCRMHPLGYVTITNDSISLNKPLKENFLNKGIQYKSLPALKIGRLCVDDRYARRGIGRLILIECIKRACFLNDNTACRFVTVDAKRHPERDKDSLQFYLQAGFSILEHKGLPRSQLAKQHNGTTPLYFDIYPLARQIGVIGDEQKKDT